MRPDSKETKCKMGTISLWVLWEKKTHAKWEPTVTFFYPMRQSHCKETECNVEHDQEEHKNMGIMTEMKRMGI
jgi:hypothetical protein